MSPRCLCRLYYPFESRLAEVLRAEGVEGGHIEACPLSQKFKAATQRSAFAIGDSKWPGISKLVEEAGEVQQVCGKLLGTRGALEHWDGSNLKTRLEDEIADLVAAAYFVTQKNGLDEDRMAERIEEKMRLFEQWHEGDRHD